WEPLVAIADCAGGRWPSRARAAACAFVRAAEEHSEEANWNLQLLSDVREVFDTTGAEFIQSSDLALRLRQLPDSPWDAWEMRPGDVAKRLRRYDIRPTRSRIGGPQI